MSDHFDEAANESQTVGSLNPSAASALDFLLERGFEARDHELSRSATRLKSLLALLDRPAEDGPALLRDSPDSTILVDVTMARVMRASERDLAGRIHPKRGLDSLDPASAASLDELLASGWREPSATPSPVGSLLSLLAARDSADGSRSLVDRTLARVQSQIESRRDRFRLSPDRSPAMGRSGFRLSDLVGVAAAILIGASVLWPMLIGSRNQARDAVCSANLARAALGFSLYAADNEGRLPQARASFLGGTWWDVGREDRSHSANLYLLVKGGYASLQDLACPGNHAAVSLMLDSRAVDWKSAEEVSYSYQLPSPGRPGWSADPRRVILTDKSPVIHRSRLGEKFDPHESSRNHGGRGQQILFGDASVRFHARPVLADGDNIWLPGRQSDSGRTQTPLTGREIPQADDDAFVGP